MVFIPDAVIPQISNSSSVISTTAHTIVMACSNLASKCFEYLTDTHGSMIAIGGDQSDDFTIDISNHPKGIYYLKIKQGGLQQVRKLVLQ